MLGQATFQAQAGGLHPDGDGVRAKGDFFFFLSLSPKDVTLKLCPSHVGNGVLRPAWPFVPAITLILGDCGLTVGTLATSAKVRGQIRFEPSRAECRPPHIRSVQNCVSHQVRF